MTVSVPLAIMQGRLSPPADGRIQSFPRDTWAAEIEAAPLAGIGAIEWIYDTYGDGANPIETDDGIARVSQLGRDHGVRVDSICADWFMEERLIGGDTAARAAARRRLHWLIDRGRRLGINRMVLPFVDDSALVDRSLEDQAVAAIEEALPAATQAGIELHLETSLGPDDFARFLARLPDPAVRVNYDIGNSAALGYEPAAEFAAYGSRVGSVHIKDRVLGGTTVALGTGHADFDAVGTELDRVGYRGPFVLQVARGAPGDEVATTRAHGTFVRNLLRQHHLSVAG